MRNGSNEIEIPFKSLYSHLPEIPFHSRLHESSHHNHVEKAIKRPKSQISDPFCGFYANAPTGLDCRIGINKIMAISGRSDPMTKVDTSPRF